MHGLRLRHAHLPDHAPRDSPALTGHGPRGDPERAQDAGELFGTRAIRIGKHDPNAMRAPGTYTSLRRRLAGTQDLWRRSGPLK